MSGEQLHQLLDEIERIHGLYSPVALGFAAALACGDLRFCLEEDQSKCSVLFPERGLEIFSGAS